MSATFRYIPGGLGDLGGLLFRPYDTENPAVIGLAGRKVSAPQTLSPSAMRICGGQMG